VNNQIATNNTVEELSNQLIAQRLANIEQICSRSVRLSIYDQQPTTTMPITTTLDSSSIITTTGTTVPVIDNSNLLRNNNILQ
jgi:predicted ribosome quality control (RQC) complex YloA/Tae2 family protein